MVAQHDNLDDLEIYNII